MRPRAPTPAGGPEPRTGIWSTIQAAIMGGWGPTTRFILIIGALALLIIFARSGAATLIADMFSH
ncbi:hypothetical protein Rhe02_09400 [Rhizocola hellebori]|uniref:Uncharacterized protein n=1 Tax=Rhizocola hellebori TaxID=1392758 RepID=A0A8J3Q3W4_9ACTN|nr:hypothetical protein Rhe02_09400 [Rhizocola hellebori]